MVREDPIDLDAIARSAQSSAKRPSAIAAITDRESYNAAVKQIGAVFLKDQPRELGGLATLRPDIAYHMGTTAPDVALKFGRHTTGLDVPAHLTRRPMPIDVIGVYATGIEVFGSRLDPQLIIATLPGRDILTTLASLATLLGRVEDKPFDRDRDREIAALFRAPHRGRAEDLINQGRVLVTAQAIMGLIKAALVLCRPRPMRSPDSPLWIFLALLAIQDSYGDRQDDTGEQIAGIHGDPRSVISVIRSQLFSFHADLVTTLAHSQLRWRELPAAMSHLPQYVNLEEAFEEATGVTLDDFVTVGLAIWSQCQRSNASVLLNDGLGLRLPRRRVDAAIRLIAASPPDLAAEVRRTEGEDGFEWSFDALRRYPVVRLYGARLVVLSPRLVLERVFSLVRWDIEYALTERGKTAEAARVRHFWQLMCEADALAALSAIAPDQGPLKRLYREDELARAFGSKRRRPKLSDFAIDYPGVWIVGDITSSTLSREIEGRGAQAALESGLAKVVAKARQIESTIGFLRSDEAKVTGAATPGTRRYMPLLVMAEGFPVSAVTSALLAHRLDRAGVLRSPDIGPLHLVDNEELSILEALAVQGHTILDLLAAHEHGSFSGMSLKDFLLVEKGLSPSNRTERLRGPFERAWAPILRAIAFNH